MDEESEEQYHKETHENRNSDEIQEWSQTSQSALSTSAVTGRPKHTGRWKRERLIFFCLILNFFAHYYIIRRHENS